MSDATLAASLADLPGRYRVILCDIWGCVHNGVSVFPEAQRLLEKWIKQGRIVLLLTNAPRPASAVCHQLDGLRLDRASYSGVITSGDTGIAALFAEGRSEAGFIGTAADREILGETGLELLEGPTGDAVICTGLNERLRDPSDYDPDLIAMRARGARLHCFNPDRIVMRGELLEPCAGAIAERYEAMGGSVSWYGKPYPAVYQRALAIASDMTGRRVDRDEVVAVGDSLSTDFVGAARAGFAFVFITHGIEGEKIDDEGAASLIARFSAEQDIELPDPIAVARQLA